MSALSEGDTRAKLIDPAIHKRGGQRISFAARRQSEVRHAITSAIDCNAESTLDARLSAEKTYFEVENVVLSPISERISWNCYRISNH